MPPKIGFVAERFNRRVMPRDSGAVDAAEHELLLTAATMGDSSVFGGPRRSHYELVWRIYTIRFALESRGSGWTKSGAYNRLDASEKSSVSYFLGMVQASFMATELLKLENVVHVDAVLRLLGEVPKKSRPDLVGYQPSPTLPNNGRALIEAKGRTGGFAVPPLTNAKKQLESAPMNVLNLVGKDHLSVASLAHFAQGTWTSHLIDPPATRVGQSEVSGSAYRGLVNLASLVPVADAIDDLRQLFPGRVNETSIPEMIQVTLPRVGMSIGMPTQLLEEIRTVVPAPDFEGKTADVLVDDHNASIWSEGMTERRQRVDEIRGELLDFRQGRPFALNADGVLVEPTESNPDAQPEK